MQGMYGMCWEPLIAACQRPPRNLFRRDSPSSALPYKFFFWRVLSARSAVPLPAQDQFRMVAAESLGNIAVPADG